MRNISQNFMENAVILFNMVAILFVNTNSWFNNVFKYMCVDLGVIY